MSIEQLPVAQPRLAVNAAEDRWRPSRAGLVNVWQFDNEVLEFEHGRLVLYGPNGSGKTMALELLLPYLLDANGKPGRLSTSGADRGGLWDRITGYESDAGRTGYLWMEFVRTGGEAFTIGARLRAKPSSGGDKHWFSTTQRVGHDLHLVDDRSRPLSVEQLKEALGDAGQLWGSDTDGYRNAVRTTLFPGWSADRLDALIATLLVVRKQHVTDGLSPKVLSAHLSEALPPLDQEELGRVADGFADLDRRRDHIAQLEDDAAAARKLVRANRDYVRAVVGRVTTTVTQSQTAVDNVTRRVRELSEKHRKLITKRDELEARARALGDEDDALDARLQGLHASEAYKQGGQLNLLRDQVRSAKAEAQAADRDARGDEEAADRFEEAARAARSQADTAAAQARSARVELEQTAALLGAEFIDIGDGSLASACDTWIEGRRGAVEEVRRELREHARAIDRRTEREGERDDCENELTESEALLESERKAAEEALAIWRSEVDGWTSTAGELGPWLVESPLDDPATASSVVSEARRRAEEPLVGQRSRLERGGEDLEREIKEACSERDEWAAGRDPEPETPPGRRDRSDLPGHAFWRLVQFRDGVESELRGRLEAALADSRVLDAWVTPDGLLALGDDEADIVMRPPEVIASRATLADVLEPDPAADAVPRARTDALLRSIRLVGAEAHAEATVPGLAIGRDGTWRAHRLAGRAAPGPARFIGASSRAAARAARIAELDTLIDAVKVRKAENDARRGAIERSLAACEAEQRTFPSPEDALQARRTVELGEVRTQHKTAALAKATERVKEASRVVQECFRALNLVATRHELPTDPEKLDDVATTLHQMGRQVRTFETRHERSIAAADAASRASERAEDTRTRATAARTRAQALARNASSRQAQFEEVDRAIGADYRDVVQRIGAITSRRGEVRREAEAIATSRTRVAEEVGSVDSRLQSAREDRQRAEEERSIATTRFTAATRDGLLAAAEVPDPPAAADLATFTATLEAARRVRAWGKLRTDIDDAGLQRLSNNVVQQVADAERQLMGRADLTFDTTDEGWSIVRARRDAVRGSAHDLRDGLRDELEAARAELTRKQQELFEKILSGSVREHLRDRLWAAQALVDRINDILGLVRTEAGGVKVHLQWEIDPDLDDASELRRAKDLLLRDSPLAESRKELDAFLQGRIERIRSAENDTGEWRDRLAEMLNYRAWHRFRVMVHHKRFGETPAGAREPQGEPLRRREDDRHGTPAPRRRDISLRAAAGRTAEHRPAAAADGRAVSEARLSQQAAAARSAARPRPRRRLHVGQGTGANTIRSTGSRSTCSRSSPTTARPRPASSGTAPRCR